MRLEDIFNEASKRKFVELNGITIKQRNKEVLDELKKLGVDYDVVIDVALENLNLEKIIKEANKKTKQNRKTNSAKKENSAEKNVTNNVEENEKNSSEKDENKNENSFQNF